MHITFILPAVGKNPGRPYVSSWLMEPLAIGVLAALTPTKYGRSFFDDRLETIDYEVRTDLVAIPVEAYTARRAYQIAKRFRDRGVPVVMGGVQATLMPLEVAQYADSVVVGEAEGIWPTVLADAEAGCLQREYRATCSAPYIAMADRSVYGGRTYLPVTLIETARGCTRDCEFCTISAASERTYRTRPIPEVVAELQALKTRFVFFVDDNFTMARRRTIQLLTSIKPLGIRWIGQAGLDAADDPALLQLMRESGCVGVLIGFESLRPDCLQQIGKDVNLGSGNPEEHYRQALRKFARAGISIYGTFVFGYNGDTRTDFERTLRFSIEHKMFLTAFNHLVPFPGTPLYDRLEKENRLLLESWWLSEDYTFGDVAFIPDGFLPEELAALCYEYRHKFYRPWSVLRRAFGPNCNSLAKALMFFWQSASNGRDVYRRQGLPLGVPGEELE